MFIKIDLQSGTPIYEQLYNVVIAGIAAGEIVPGETLPSGRVLGRDLGINLHTVNKAYNLLRLSGYLTIQRSRGVKLNEKSSYPANADFKKHIQEKLSPHIGECIARGMSKKQTYELISNIYGGQQNG